MDKYYKVTGDMKGWKAKSEDFLWENIHATQARYLLSQRPHNSDKWLQKFNEFKTAAGKQKKDNDYKSRIFIYFFLFVWLLLILS